eukprot:gene6895-8823_t
MSNFRKCNTKLSFNIESGDPDMAIALNESKVEQVLRNILTLCSQSSLQDSVIELAVRYQKDNSSPTIENRDGMQRHDRSGRQSLLPNPLSALLTPSPRAEASSLPLKNRPAFLLSSAKKYEDDHSQSPSDNHSDIEGNSGILGSPSDGHLLMDFTCDSSLFTTLPVDETGSKKDCIAGIVSSPLLEIDRLIGGSGLGFRLSLAYHILKKHGGSLTLTSASSQENRAIGNRICIQVSLPCARLPNGIRHEESKREQSLGLLAERTYTGVGERDGREEKRSELEQRSECPRSKGRHTHSASGSNASGGGVDLDLELLSEGVGWMGGGEMNHSISRTSSSTLTSAPILISGIVEPKQSDVDKSNYKEVGTSDPYFAPV